MRLVLTRVGTVAGDDSGGKGAWGQVAALHLCGLRGAKAALRCSFSHSLRAIDRRRPRMRDRMICTSFLIPRHPIARLIVGGPAARQVSSAQFLVARPGEGLAT